MFISDLCNPEIAEMVLELASSQASHSQLITIHKKTKADLDAALILISKLTDKINALEQSAKAPLKNKCIACGADHGGLSCPQMRPSY